MVHRLAVPTAAFRAVVLGMAGSAPPFADVPFHPVQPSRWPGRQTQRYAAGAARALRDLRPALIEVHNRPEVAVHLAASVPESQVALFLHNDPQGMRGARTAADRAALLTRLAGIATVSEFLAQRFRAGAPSSGRLVVLPNCIDLKSLPRSGQRTRKILFAGRIVADKGADSFVAAWELAAPHLPGWTAEMIGADRFSAASPDTAFLRDLRPRALKAGITLSGYQPYPAVLAAMAEASVVVVPSRWEEPFGLTALEAMASGAALVCSPRGGLREVVGQAALLIDPDDPATIAAAMREASAEPRRSALAQAGLRQAAHFDLPDAMARLNAFRDAILCD